MKGKHEALKGGLLDRLLEAKDQLKKSKDTLDELEVNYDLQLFCCEYFAAH